MNFVPVRDQIGGDWRAHGAESEAGKPVGGFRWVNGIHQRECLAGGHEKDKR